MEGEVPVLRSDGGEWRGFPRQGGEHMAGALRLSGEGFGGLWSPNVGSQQVITAWDPPSPLQRPLTGPWFPLEASGKRIWVGG